MYLERGTIFLESLDAFNFPRRELSETTHTITRPALHFLQLLKSKGYEEWQKMVLLLIDEMYIKEDIIYNKHTGRIVGFTDLGDVNNHLLR